MNKQIKRSRKRKRRRTNNTKKSKTNNYVLCSENFIELYQTNQCDLLHVTRKDFKCSKNDGENKFPKQEVQKNKANDLFFLKHSVT